LSGLKAVATPPTTGTVGRPLVSVVVCAYNYARYLPAALESALAQRYAPLEVVVVDDGSTDETPAVLAAYGDRIRVVRQPNAGLTAATMRGIAEARGEVLALLDADDIWHPDKLAHQVALLQARPEVGLVATDMELMDGDGVTFAPSYFRHHDLRPVRGRALGRLLQQNAVPAPTIAVRRSMLGHVLPIDPVAWCQDWWLALKTAEIAEVDVVDLPLVRYRIHADNMCGDASGERYLPTLRKDNLFRRWMLGHLDLAGVAPADLRSAWTRLEQNTAYAARIAGRPGLEELAAQGRDPEACRAHLAAGRPLAALAADPLDADARAAFDGATLPPAQRVAWAEERYAGGDAATASATLTAILGDAATDPDTAALAASDLAVIALAGGDLAGCRAAAHRALEHDAQRLEALEALARCADSDGDRAQALVWWQRAVAAAPGDPACRAGLEAAQAAAATA
jgi:hypothetical protein